MSKSQNKEMTLNEGPKLWDYIKMISQTKEIPEFDEHFEKTYEPFMVSRSFSLSGDNSVIVAQAINKSTKLSKKSHFLFLHGLVRRGKRFNKWPKQLKEKRILTIMEMFDYSYAKAKESSGFISDEDIKAFEDSKDTGGVASRRAKKKK